MIDSASCWQGREERDLSPAAAGGGWKSGRAICYPLLNFIVSLTSRNAAHRSTHMVCQDISKRMSCLKIFFKMETIQISINRGLIK